MSHADKLKQPSTSIECLTTSPEMTQAYGAKLGALLQPGDVVALIGDLGTGKTCLTHGIARGLGLLPDQQVSSPSYVLIHEYQARCPIYHIDLYRIHRSDEIVDLGLEEYLYGRGICVIEWAERASEWLPPEHLRIYLHWVDEHTRRLKLEAIGSRFEKILRRLGTC